MKKAAIIILVAAAVVTLLALANRETYFSEDKLRRIAGDAGTLIRLAQADPVDFATFTATYDEGPRALAKWVDAKLDIEMDDKITTSLKAADTGAYPRINAQIAALTVTRVLREYFQIQARLETGDETRMRMRWAVAGMIPALDGAAPSGIAEPDVYTTLRDFAEAKSNGANSDAIAKAIKIAVAAAWIAEVRGIERAREANLPNALIHAVRALQFMHILYEDYSPTHREDAVFIYGELQKDPREMDLAELRVRMGRVLTTVAPSISTTALDAPQGAPTDGQTTN
ncbi:MAG: hypothetical protein IT350_05240 [Deltaproteobacteria bacterium]|nr:hypothetical protein [Deltaproteobacteria bacterium]